MSDYLNPFYSPKNQKTPRLSLDKKLTQAAPVFGEQCEHVGAARCRARAHKRYTEAGWICDLHVTIRRRVGQTLTVAEEWTP